MAVVRVLLEFLGNFIFIFIFQGPEKSLKISFGKLTFGKYSNSLKIYPERLFAMECP